MLDVVFFVQSKNIMIIGFHTTLGNDPFKEIDVVVASGRAFRRWTMIVIGFPFSGRPFQPASFRVLSVVKSIFDRVFRPPGKFLCNFGPFVPQQGMGFEEDFIFVLGPGRFFENRIQEIDVSLADRLSDPTRKLLSNLAPFGPVRCHDNNDLVLVGFPISSHDTRSEMLLVYSEKERKKRRKLLVY